ncbi:hypothetical protein ACIBG8_46375 [Nonomuraea sp. NPDC050556]|uniref:hypothetical protein n=1 Tax=Nonomuraea sp. NPDC050556 TaxID=3364369 RepID=UPI00378F4164
MDLLGERGQRVAELSSALQEVRSGLRELLDGEDWREFTGPSGELVLHEDFAEFVTSDPPRGLGVTQAVVRSLVAEEAPAVEAEPAEEEAPEEKPPVESPALRRLREDAPALHNKVVAGELSTNAAMVQAGFRPRTISIPVSRPESAAKTLRSKLSKEELVELVNLLSVDL